MHWNGSLAPAFKVTVRETLLENWRSSIIVNRRPAMWLPGLVFSGGVIAAPFDESRKDSL
jgi:hypothetical protein